MIKLNPETLSVVMLDTTVAVGGHTLMAPMTYHQVDRPTLLGRNTVPDISNMQDSSAGFGAELSPEDSFIDARCLMD